MRRNVVAIVGSAGTIPHELRCSVETLARALGDAGFDLVTGSMDGVMRAAARGHGRSVSGANLVHVEPGWGRAWERNPYPASIVRTNLGSMRNHLVVRSADLVVAVSGGSGTLSEMAIVLGSWRGIVATARRAHVVRSSGRDAAILILAIRVRRELRLAEFPESLREPGGM